MQWVWQFHSQAALKQQQQKHKFLQKTGKKQNHNHRINYSTMTVITPVLCETASRSRQFYSEAQTPAFSLKLEARIFFF